MKLTWLQRALGAMDSVTGALLIAAPEYTLRLMGVRTAPDSPLMVSWVGVFVLAVGASYFLVWRLPESVEGWAGWRMQWRVTALVRAAVGVFVGWQVMRGGLEAAWVSVAVTDLVVAGLQVLGLKRGWLSGGAFAK